jgi:hypothetical protein
MQTSQQLIMRRSTKLVHSTGSTEPQRSATGKEHSNGVNACRPSQESGVKDSSAAGHDQQHASSLFTHATDSYRVLKRFSATGCSEPWGVWGRFVRLECNEG